MQLMRDWVPGVAPLYIKWDLPVLLERHSPLRQLRRPVSSSVEAGTSGMFLKKEPPPERWMSEGNSMMFLVETGESRTPNADHSVAAALRELSVCLARLADTLDWTGHTSKHNQRADH